MPIFKTSFQAFTLAAVLSIVLVPYGFAATKTPAPTPAPDASAAKAADPDPSANPILASIIKMGAKAYYMGSRSGLDGWFVVKDNRVQVVYTTEDKQTIIVGAMFDDKGSNISAIQTGTLVGNNKDVSAALTAAIKSVSTPGSSPLPTAPPMSSPLAAAAPATQAPQPAPAAPPVAPTATPLSPGEKLLQDLTNAAGVNVGFAAAPLVLMVMDPNCPHCQATWRALRVAVFKNNLRIRLVPIVPPDSDDERAAGQLLLSGDPLSTWDKYVEGDKTQLAGTPDKIVIKALQSNHEMIDSWGINQTPYMVYRAKNGKIKIVEGEPESVDVILSDLTPQGQ